MTPPAKKSKTGGDSLEELRQRAKSLGVPESLLDAIFEQAETKKELTKEAEKLTKEAKELAGDSLEELQQRAKSLGVPEGVIAVQNIRSLSWIVQDAEFIYKGSTVYLLKDPPEMNLNSIGTQNASTGTTKHGTASSSKIEVHLQDFKGVYEKLGQKQSALLLKFLNIGSNKEKTEANYGTERDISDFVTAALDDAKSIAEAVTGKKFYVHHEFSLWSDRPDHIVLYDAAGNDPVLVVEDKKPLKHEFTHTEDEKNKNVLGQIFDYLMAMRCLGHSAPFAVLSTFEKSWLFWGQDEDSNKIVGLEDRLEEVKAKIRTAIDSPTKADAAINYTQSPPKCESPKSVTNAPETNQDTHFSSEFKKHVDNKTLCQSEAYGSKQLVPLLVTAIICGLARNPTSPPKKYSSDRKRYNDIALHLTKESYDWGHLNCRLGHPIVTPGDSGTPGDLGTPGDSGTPRDFFAIQILGRGHTSKVFDAYDGSGNRCAIKMYIKQDKKQSKEESKKKWETSCKREAERLQTCYPFLKDKVCVQELNKFPCVIMPYFRPLSKKERNEFRENENGKLRTKVHACLLALAEKGLKYHESDLRWRHIGYYEIENKKEVVMFDLADLEEMNEEEKEDLDAFVGSQIESLLDRLPTDQTEKNSCIGSRL